MGYYDFPHTRNYDTDLGYLIKRYFELSTDFESLEKNFNDLKAWCIAQLNSEALKTLVANKLDEWLQDGTLEALINNPLNHVTTYDTVVEMLPHSGLLEGSKIYCTGADSANDGKGGHFRIRARLSTDIIDNYKLYLIDGGIKVAERIGEKIENNVCVVLGDSWTDQTTFNEFPNRVGWLHDRIIFNPNIHCYGIAGSTTSGLDAQLTTAVNDESFNNDNVTTVIILCGVNDYRTDVEPLTVRNNLNNLYQRILTVFPNAKTYGMCNCYSPLAFSSDKTFHGYRDFYALINGFSDMKGVLFPYYDLSRYLVTQNCFEYNTTDTSFHTSDLGQKLVGKVFDYLLEHSTPCITQDISSEINGILNVYGIDTNNNNWRVSSLSQSVYLKTVGNDCEIIYNIFFSIINHDNIKALAFDYDLTLNNLYKSVLIRPEELLFYNAYVSNKDYLNQSYATLFNKLYTGEYDGVQISNGLIAFINPNVNKPNMLRIVFKSRF